MTSRLLLLHCQVLTSEPDFCCIKIDSNRSAPLEGNSNAHRYWRPPSLRGASRIEISDTQKLSWSLRESIERWQQWNLGSSFIGPGESEETSWNWIEIIKEDVRAHHHFALLPFLIASRTFWDSEHVKPAPSGSTIRVLTLLSSTTIAYLNEKKNQRAAVTVSDGITEMIEHCPRRQSCPSPVQEPRKASSTPMVSSSFVLPWWISPLDRPTHAPANVRKKELSKNEFTLRVGFEPTRENPSDSSRFYSEHLSSQTP